jgi:integrase
VVHGLVEVARAVIRRALNIAVRWQLIAVNPATLVDAPRAEQHEITPLTATEARRLIQAAEGIRMQARWLIGLALGLRQGETLGLQWEDVDFDARLLRVRRALGRWGQSGPVHRRCGPGCCSPFFAPVVLIVQAAGAASFSGRIR